MNRRAFAGLSLAAVGAVFVPQFGRWYQQTQVWRVELRMQAQRIAWAPVAPGGAANFGITTPFDEVLVHGRSGVVGTYRGYHFPGGSAVTIETDLCYRAVTYPDGRRVVVEAAPQYLRRA